MKNLDDVLKNTEVAAIVGVTTAWMSNFQTRFYEAPFAPRWVEHGMQRFRTYTRRQAIYLAIALHLRDGAGIGLKRAIFLVYLLERENAIEDEDGRVYHIAEPGSPDLPLIIHKPTSNPDPGGCVMLSFKISHIVKKHMKDGE